MGERIENVGPVIRPNRSYPWEEWADGSAWLIKRYEDFTCSTATMRQNLVVRAARTGMTVKTHVSLAEPDVIRFQFSRRDQP